MKVFGFMCGTNTRTAKLHINRKSDKISKKFGVILPLNSEQEMSCFPGLHFESESHS
jgi:hypothetical protein